MSSFLQDAPTLARDWGIHLNGITHYADERRVAMDAATTYAPVTAMNSGIPAVVNTIIDPEVIRTLITPTRSEEIYGSGQKGNRLTKTVLFPVVENGGYAASYGDFSDAGDSSVNANWVSRQSFYFQTWAKYGDLESEQMGSAGLSWVNEQRIAAASVLNKQSNLMNLFGMSGLELYGALNDPQLPTAIQPTSKTSGSTTVTAWSDTSDPNAVYTDFVTLFTRLNAQMMGNIDNQTPIKVVLPSERSPVLAYTNSFGITLEDMLKKSFPNMALVFLPEAGTQMSGGNQTTTIMQMFVPEVEGISTVTTAFSEKLLMHRVEQYSTNMRQKMSQGGWGTIWRRPMACATMVGI